MQIWQLIDNTDFSFNVHYRILKYLGEGKTVVMYDNESLNFDSIDESLMDKWISAINMGNDGVVEIEYADLINEEV